MPSVVTQPYYFPPAGLSPPAEECSQAQLLELAMHACRSSSDLGALQGSPEHLGRICEMLGALHKRVVEQEIELEDNRLRLTAAGRMMSGARDQTAIVRCSLGVEVAAHRVTKQHADQEHELRIVAEEELRRVSERHARDSSRLARAMRLLALAFDRTSRVVHSLLDDSGNGEALCSAVRAVDVDVCLEEETLVDVLDARCVAAEPWICDSMDGKET